MPIRCLSACGARWSSCAILAQRQQGLHALRITQIVAVDQALVQADGAVDFAAAAEQVAQRDLGLEGFLVQLGDMQEQLDGLVRLLVEQVVQAPEIGARQAADLAVTVTLPAAPTDYPAGQRRQGNEQEEPEPLGDEIHLRSASIKRLGGGNRGHGRGDRLVGTAQLGVERNDHAHQHQARTDDDADQQRSDDRHADRGLELGEHQVDGHLVHVHGTDDQPEKQHRQQDQQTKNLHATAPVAGGRSLSDSPRYSHAVARREAQAGSASSGSTLLTRSRSSLPGLKWGTCLPGRATDSPVFGLRPRRGGR
ncbi:hypothetical protein G6F31_014790 [Rhizopus arrhizus]|nr:hypothetical protein G6F31_014790 [Rhizopus arrhizus]